MSIDPLLLGFIVVAVIGLIVVLVWRGRGFEWNTPIGPIKIPEIGGGARPLALPGLNAKQLDYAFERYADVAGGLVLLVNPAPTAQVANVARNWFRTVAENVEDALRTSQEEHYRVAIWHDVEPAGPAFQAIAHAGFDANAPHMQTLTKTDTLGGLAHRRPDGEYYCPDVEKDQAYVPHDHSRSYQSVLAIALGPAAKRWGVMTIDSRAANGFTETDRSIARRFAGLCAVGMAVWILHEDATREEAPGTTR